MRQWLGLGRLVDCGMCLYVLTLPSLRTSSEKKKARMGGKAERGRGRGLVGRTRSAEAAAGWAGEAQQDGQVIWGWNGMVGVVCVSASARFLWGRRRWARLCLHKARHRLLFFGERERAHGDGSGQRRATGCGGQHAT